MSYSGGGEDKVHHITAARNPTFTPTRKLFNNVGRRRLLNEEEYPTFGAESESENGLAIRAKGIRWHSFACSYDPIHKFTFYLQNTTHNVLTAASLTLVGMHKSQKARNPSPAHLRSFPAI